MAGLVKEFKEFAVRGNVVDMAVGIIIGGAFGKIVASFVADVLMPPIGLVLGGTRMVNLFLPLGPGEFETLEAAKAAGVPTLNYGLFLMTVLDFLIIAFSIFLFVRAVNRLRRRQEAAAPAAAAEPTEKDCPFCLTKIPVKATRCAHCTSQLA